MTPDRTQRGCRRVDNKIIGPIFIGNLFSMRAPFPEPEILTLPARNIVGQRMEMSVAADKTTELWQGFMPQKKKIAGAGTLISMNRYPAGYFDRFDPAVRFEKWAAAETDISEPVPLGLESCIIPGGLYAGFLHQGIPHDFFATGQYIYTIWLPQSGYVLDSRPHFFVMDERYKHNDPASEEMFWIPVKKPVS